MPEQANVEFDGPSELQEMPLCQQCESNAASIDMISQAIAQFLETPLAPDQLRREHTY